MILHFSNYVTLIITFLLVILFVCFFTIYIRILATHPVVRYEDEKFYLDVSSEPFKRLRFPDLNHVPSVSLSVIIPAYNEETRLPVMLDECFEYLKSRHEQDRRFTYEVIIVDDGSLDDTTKVALKYSKKYGCDQCRVLTLRENRGKGGAVRLGMASARGEYLLFADADGATKFSDFEKLEEEMKSAEAVNSLSIIVGSRAHLEKKAIATRSLFRTVLMYGFHFLVWLFCVRSIRDTQCGYKLFTREAARYIFPVLHVQRWAFDVEMLYIAEQKKMAIREVAVNWTEIEGSKLVPFWSWLQMGLDLVLIWFKYLTGLWRVHDSKKCN